ncbi:MAG TPA: sigma-54-dependent Fis family transcriptional regulator [Bacteroidota bacterium]
MDIIDDRRIRKFFDIQRIRLRSPMTEQPVKNDFDALYEVTQRINSILEPSALLENVLEIAMKHLSAERGFIILADTSSTDGFTVTAARNFDQKQLSGDFAASSSVVKTVLSSGEPVLTFDALTDERFESSTSIIAQRIQSIICIPLRLTDRVTGAVYLDSTKSRKRFTDESLKFLTVFGNLSAIAIENARQFVALKDENRRLRDEADPSLIFKGMVGRSKKWTDVLETTKRLLDVDVAVLITGESGTGKELIARAIHDHCARKDHSFVALNCSAIPEQLLESELFGHKRGAYTGATADKAGLFEIAHEGTLFLDEIADLPLPLQSKLLRVLEEKQIRRVGDVQTKKIDARIVAATNKDLHREVKEGRFREDLYFRLNVVHIQLPPLRERRDDIPALAEYFFEKACNAHRRQLTGIHPDVMKAFVHAPWQGNIRELQNTIERAVVLCKTSQVTMEDIATMTEAPYKAGSMTLADYERQIIESTLNEMGGNRTRTAEKLGVSLRWLQYRLKEWGSE